MKLEEAITIYLYLKARATDSLLYTKPTEKEIRLFREAEDKIAKTGYEFIMEAK